MLKIIRQQITAESFLGHQDPNRLQFEIIGKMCEDLTKKASYSLDVDYIDFKELTVTFFDKDNEVIFSKTYPNFAGCRVDHLLHKRPKTHIIEFTILSDAGIC